MVSQLTRSVHYRSKYETSPPIRPLNEQRLWMLDLTLNLLIARTCIGEYWSEGLQDVANLLASLPLQTAEFVTVNQLLQNALHYCNQNEFGTATFELRSLRGHLQHL